MEVDSREYSVLFERCFHITQNKELSKIFCDRFSCSYIEFCEHHVNGRHYSNIFVYSSNSSGIRRICLYDKKHDSESSQAFVTINNNSYKFSKDNLYVKEFLKVVETMFRKEKIKNILK